MTKPSKNAIILIVAAIIILSGFGLVMLNVFSESTESVDAAEQFVDSFLRAYHKKDPNAGAFLSTSVVGNSDIMYSGFQGHLAGSLTHTIRNGRADEIEPEITWVDVEIENIDMAELIKTIENSNETDPNRLLESLTDSIVSPNAPRRTFQVSVIVMEFPIGMKIVMNDELSDALLGGFNTYVFSMIEEGDEQSANES